METAMGLEPDLTQLEDLSDEAILAKLRERYQRDLIYTQVSDILIAINPCKPLPIYDTAHHNEYIWDNLSADAEPHVFNVAAKAYRRMAETGKDQVIILSGESGAGKTENTKYMVNHMVHMCQGEQMELHDKIIKVNQLLEAFGNAKTIMNTNSSRFTKYLELRFDKNDGMLRGAVVRDYMLEKSRVVQRPEGEGIFHIFYALFAGCPRETRKDLFLSSHPGEYRIMKSDVDSLTMGDYYSGVYKENMEILNKIHVDKDAVLTILASIINLADIEFVQSDEGYAEISDATPYCHAASLLDVKEDNLGYSLIASKHTIRGQDIVTYKTEKQAKDSRDTLVKMLYERVFGYLVRQINRDLQPDKSFEYITIGILDISGFEKLTTNSFEQLCINLMNEKLQYFINKSVFLKETDKSEGMQLQEISSMNNKGLTELFEKPTDGLLVILDEMTHSRQGSDTSLVRKLHDQYNRSQLYLKTEEDLLKFGIRHFAAQVWYDARNFLEKNKDRLNKELMTVMKASSNKFISDLFTVERGPTGTISRENYIYRAFRKSPGESGPHHTPQTQKDGKRLAKKLGKSLKKKFGSVFPPSDGMSNVAPHVEHMTAASYSRKTWLELLQNISGSEPFLIRCLKANTDLFSDCFDNNVVLDQLKYNGIGEIAKIKKIRYTIRKPYIEFLERYTCLHGSLCKAETIKEKARSILLLTPPAYHGDFACGETRVFMTTEVEIWLENQRRKKEEERRVIKSIDDHSVYRPPSARIKHSCKTDNVDGTAENAPGTREFWDVCQVKVRERNSDDVHGNCSMQIIKTAVYILLFIVLLFCAIAQKIALVILTTDQYNATTSETEQYNATITNVDKTEIFHSGVAEILLGEDQRRKEEEERKENLTVKAGRYYLLGIVIMIPYGLTFITSLLRWLFRSYPFPRKSTLILCFLMEGCHSVGLCLLCFDILPEMDMVPGLMILSGVAIMPALLKLVFTSETDIRGTKENKRKKLCILIMDLIALIIQCAYIPLVLITNNFFEDGDHDLNILISVEYVLAIFLISFSWWENFVDDSFIYILRWKNRWQKFILPIKFDLQEARPIISIFMSVWKIGLTCIMCWVLGRDEDVNIAAYFQESFDKFKTQPLAENVSILTITLATFFGYCIGYTACKLKLQQFSYDIPLILSTPLAVLIVALDCDHYFLEMFTNEVLQYGCTNTSVTWWHYLTGFVAWLSLYWIARYLFFPKTNRLAETERLFVNPYYCGILFEQHMMLNRTRHNRTIYRELKEGKTFFKILDFDSTVNLEGEVEQSRYGSNSTTDVTSNAYPNPKSKVIPMIYACATMWHENRQEMLQLMKSLFRMDKDQCLRRHAELLTGTQHKEFYDFEAHILFDDAMELNADKEWVPNQFVKSLISVIDEAASFMYEKSMKLKPPIKVACPYGWQLIWTMPGDNFLYLHLKDKQKIRHGKRWSQVMYMFYLLRFRIVRLCQETVRVANEQNRLSELANCGKGDACRQAGRSHLHRAFDEQVLKKASNTFLLALDGDVDFSPMSVRLLLDRLQNNENVGAACGRIHPTGRGAVVWLQIFEYAIVHWLQKATEHVFGCVLCSPGCFSLFRGSALMDDNVMKKYTLPPTEPIHHLMYDRGEDRWLSNLLLQQGYRIDYVPGADAFTYVPESIGEFFSQRRRWIPSTMANIFDFLADYKNTVESNSNINILYITYQATLIISTVLGPAFVLMLIAGANVIAFNVGWISAYIIALCPAILYFALCFILKPTWQILAAAIFSAFYAFMMIVFVGTVITAAQESPYHPNVIFILFLIFLFVFAAILHPKEWTCALYGGLYFLCIPTGFLLLVLYSVCNLHIVTWGTREVVKEPTVAETKAEKQKREDKKTKIERGLLSNFIPKTLLKRFKKFSRSITATRTDRQKFKDPESVTSWKNINENLNKLSEDLGKLLDFNKGHGAFANEINETEITDTVEDTYRKEENDGIFKKTKISDQAHGDISDEVVSGKEKRDETMEDTTNDKVSSVKDDLKHSTLLGMPELGKEEVFPMLKEETQFWKGFVNKYLKPLDMTDDQRKFMLKGLIELRNNACLGMAVINLLWIAINLMFQLTLPTQINIKLSETTEETDADDRLINVDVLGHLFIICFVLILLLQCAGMIVHRWHTFLHLMLMTELRNPLKKTANHDAEAGDPTLSSKEAIVVAEHLWKESVPGYLSDDEMKFDDEEITDTKEELARLMTTGSRFNVSVGRHGVLDASSRSLGITDERIDTNVHRQIRRTAKKYVDQLKIASRINCAPNRQAMPWTLQDGYRKNKCFETKDRLLSPIKQSKFDLRVGKEDLESRMGIVQPEKEEREEIRFIPGRGTVERILSRKLAVVARERRHMIDSSLFKSKITDNDGPKAEYSTIEKDHDLRSFSDC